MKNTTEKEDGVTNVSDVLMLSENGGEDSLGFGFITGKDYPQMLCFGEGYQNDDEFLFPEVRDFPSSALSSRDNAYTVDDESSRSNKRTGSGDGENRVCDSKPGKRCKRDQNKSSVGNAKVKKEKMGEKITVLQQLVSPYGKTDTATVLHETMSYIKFLQNQVQVLSSPYFKHNPLDDEDIGDVNPTLEVKDLKSYGLCLVPLAWTVHVANTNGADLWSQTVNH